MQEQVLKRMGRYQRDHPDEQQAEGGEPATGLHRGRRRRGGCLRGARHAAGRARGSACAPNPPDGEERDGFQLHTSKVVRRHGATRCRDCNRAFVISGWKGMNREEAYEGVAYQRSDGWLCAKCRSSPALARCGKGGSEELPGSVSSN